MKCFKPGDIAWIFDHDNPPKRRPVIIVRKSLCKDFSKWEQRNIDEKTGLTWARMSAQESWVVLDCGQQRVYWDSILYTRQFAQRKNK